MKPALFYGAGIPGDGAGGYGAGFEGGGGANAINASGCGFLGSHDGSGESAWLEGLSNDCVHEDDLYDVLPELDHGVLFELHTEGLRASVMQITLLSLVRRPADAIRKAARTAQCSAWPLE